MGRGEKKDPPATEMNHMTSDTSDDDLDGPRTLTKQNLPTRQPASKKGLTKLGIIGGQKRDPPKAALPTAGSPTVHSTNMQAGSTNRVLEVGHGSHALPSKPKGKLGKIGGQRNADKRTEEQTATEHVATSSASVSAKGALYAASTSERGRESIKKSVSPAPERETSQERADRNRERLKRELEVKSKVAVKKKRKF